MDPRRRALLDRLWQEGRDFDAAQPDRLDRRRNLEPESAELLNILVRTLAPAEVLELGTSTGFSALWIADALEPHGGRLTTVDPDAPRLAKARTNLEAAGVADVVTVRQADAADVLADAEDGCLPLVFLDAERPAYPDYWPDLARILAPGGLLVVDNCLSHADDVRPFRALVDASPGFRSTLVPVGAGLLLVSKDRPGHGSGVG